MFQAWEQKQERLQAMRQEQLFLRKCGHLEEILTAQEAGAPTPQHTSCSLFSLLPISPLCFLGLWLIPHTEHCVPPQYRELQKEDCLYSP